MILEIVKSKNKYYKIKKLRFVIATLIHPTAYVSQTITIKKETIIESKVIANVHLIIRMYYFGWRNCRL